MNPFRTAAFRVLAIGLALPLAALLWTVGCDVDSVDSTTSVVADDGTILNFAGLYMNPNNSESIVYPIVFPEGKQSGTILTWLRLLQYGSVLEAYDNAGLTWAGSVSFNSGTATFRLTGRTTAGQPVEIFGTLVGSDDNTSDPHATMDASWVEPNFYGNLRAKASVAPVATNSPIVTNSTKVTVSPDSWEFSSNGQTKDFEADGGNGTYTWSFTATNVKLSATSGKIITLTRTSAGNGVLSASSSSSTPGTAQITCP